MVIVVVMVIMGVVNALLPVLLCHGCGCHGYGCHGCDSGCAGVVIVGSCRMICGCGGGDDDHQLQSY